MVRSSPDSSIPMSARNSSFSSSSSSEISDSILLHMATTPAFSDWANCVTASRCGLFSKPSSATFAMYMVGFVVRRCIILTRACSFSSRSSARTGSASFKCGSSFSSSSAFVAIATLSPPFAVRMTRCNCFSQLSRSASANSVLMVSMSASGSI